MTPCLLFYRGSGVAGWLIRRWTRSPFAHVAPCVNGIVYDAFWGRPLTARPYDIARDSQTVAVPVSPAAPPDWLAAQVGKRYDKWAIVQAGLYKRGLPGQHVYDSLQGRWTCSRLSCVWAGLETRAWGLRWPPTPGDVYEMVTRDEVTGERG